MKKKKTSTRGGARKGAGRPATGVNTVNIGFVVHKDIEKPVREAVKEIVVAHKAKSGAKIAATDPPASKKGSARESVVKNKGAGKGGKQPEFGPVVSMVKKDVVKLTVGKKGTRVRDLSEPTHQVKDLSKPAPKTNYQVKSKGTASAKADQLRRFRETR